MIMFTYSMTFTTTMCWNIEPAHKNAQNVLDFTLCDFIHVSGEPLKYSAVLIKALNFQLVL